MCPEVLMMAAATKEDSLKTSRPGSPALSTRSMPFLERLPFYRHCTGNSNATKSSNKSRSFDLAAAAAELYAVACTAAAVVTASSQGTTCNTAAPNVARDNETTACECTCHSCRSTSTATTGCRVENNKDKYSKSSHKSDNSILNESEDDIDIGIGIDTAGDALLLLSVEECCTSDCCTSPNSSTATFCASAPDSCFEEEEIVMDDEECSSPSQMLQVASFQLGGGQSGGSSEQEEEDETDYHRHHNQHHHHHCRRERCHSQQEVPTTSHQRHQRNHSSASACSRSDSKSSSSGSNSDSNSTSTGSLESLLSELSGSCEVMLDGAASTPTLSKTSPWRKVRSLVTSPFIQTYKRQKYPWIQLAGHQGNFLAGQMQGTILKKKSGNEDKCFKALMEDELRHFVPQFKNVVHMNGESYIELEDLLASFCNPSIMDIKMGIRTYLEEELIKAGEKPKLRKDMYEKMVAIDPREPTPEEHALRAVTKPRYMVWRESISSTSTLGFRIDGVKLRAGGNGNPNAGNAATPSETADSNRTNKDFKRTKTEQSVSAAILQFAEEKPECLDKYLAKLRLIRETMSRSDFFRSHEMIGSSLLFVHDDTHADIWLIDFAKTYPLPEGVTINHRDEWTLGNHEDGYLTGLDNLIRLFSALQKSQ